MKHPHSGFTKLLHLPVESAVENGPLINSVKVSLCSTALRLAGHVKRPRRTLIKLSQDHRFERGDGVEEFRRVAHAVEGAVAVFEEGVQFGQAGELCRHA